MDLGRMGWAAQPGWCTLAPQRILCSSKTLQHLSLHCALQSARPYTKPETLWAHKHWGDPKSKPCLWDSGVWNDPRCRVTSQPESIHLFTPHFSLSLLALALGQFPSLSTPSFSCPISPSPATSLRWIL